MKCLYDKFHSWNELLLCLTCHQREMNRENVEPDLYEHSNSFKSFLKSKGIKIVHQNLNGLLGKIDSLRLYLSSQDIHMHDSITNTQLHIPGYTIERKDRMNGPNGGVVCHIRDDTEYIRRNDLELDGIEVIWIELKIPKLKSLLVSSLYP